MVGAETGARLYGLDGFDAVDSITIAIPRQARNTSPDNVSVRWSRALSIRDLHMIDHIPVAILPLILIQLDGGYDAEKALDSALRRGTSRIWLHREFSRHRHLGTPGAGRLLALLAERVGQRLPRSWFQRLAKRLLEEHGYLFEDEWPIHDERGRLIAELDLACVDLKVGVECQSIEWHTSPKDRARDAARLRTLRRLGWEIVDLWWADLDRMDDVVADLEIVLKKAQLLKRQANIAK